MYDPDAPTGSGFWHWLVCNIPADCRALAAGIGAGGALPAGAVETASDFGAPGYGGPCPPEGDHPHRYVFSLHALGGEVQVTPQTPAAQVGFPAPLRHPREGHADGAVQALIAAGPARFARRRATE